MRQQLGIARIMAVCAAIQMVVRDGCGGCGCGGGGSGDGCGCGGGCGGGGGGVGGGGGASLKALPQVLFVVEEETRFATMYTVRFTSSPQVSNTTYLLP
jgi:hypothetical protein